MTGEDIRSRAYDLLTAARERSLALTGCVGEDDLIKQHSRLMSPLVWDLAHVGSQEELWLLRAVGGQEPMRPEIDSLYDAFEHPRAERPRLPLLSPEESRRYIATVRERVVGLLERSPIEGDPLVENGFAFGMIVQHEQQHDETMLATHQLREGVPVLSAPPPAASSGWWPKEVLVPAGAFTMGTSTEPWALDNERPAHQVHVPAYWIDTVPVSNADYLAFMEAGGYERRELWSAGGWAHRQDAGLTGPRFWWREGGTWLRRRFGHVEPVPPDEPVVHVCWYEAEAYASWAGRRLPTEAEWEKAARHDPAAGRSRRYPWGDEEPGAAHANLGQRHLQAAPVGAYPAGASAYGVRQLIGDVWEWTSSDFRGYPGFAAFPYREYSEVFFGDEYKVLRGGSFATDPVACRGTFRNWDYPIRRQIFSGFRTARDAAPGEGV
ncbi:ergothioneine biosynthesis protein EgtB [Planotetraspora phitsanulokensis]|uniref:Hercynine oxygenase n=1 Tax=Planotetraspora phitsanulokensis TaxID=575192 RepID=A0A8J3XEA5_9ACTN|nr:ergothioneine biosynthesis protein EgtB [Planotetraspora phitsanulokensis]GII37519.1 hercynine oxygenase [Planotetraspora phitsanulokensis]